MCWERQSMLNHYWARPNPRSPRSPRSPKRLLERQQRDSHWQHLWPREMDLDHLKDRDWLVVEPTPLKNDGLRQLGLLIPNRWKVIKFHGSSHHQPGEIAVFRVYVSWIATNSWPSQNISKSYSWNSSKFDFPTNPPVSKNYHAWSCFVLIFADDPSIW